MTAPHTSHTPDSLPRRTARRHRLVTLVAVVSVGVGLLTAGRWWMTPDLFPDSGAGMSLTPRPVTRASMTVGVTAPYADEQAEPTELTFTGAASVDLSTNTAEATAEVAVCRAKAGADPIGVVSPNDVGEFCDEIEPVREGVRMVQSHWDSRERDYVIVTLTPTRPGQVHLTAVALSYQTDRSQLYRRGTNTIGLDVSITAR